MAVINAHDGGAAAVAALDADVAVIVGLALETGIVAFGVDA